MLIGENPFNFSILIRPIKEWNDYGKYYEPWNGGIMLFFVNGYIFPNNELMNVTLSSAVPEIINNLKNIPINKVVFNMKNKKEAFVNIHNIVYPKNDFVNSDFHYKIAPQEFFDKRYVIFAVSDGDSVRFLASKLKYIREISSDILDNIIVREAYINSMDVKAMIDELNNWLQETAKNPIIYKS